MSDLILHHYEMSPFAEKARRILSFKGLPWRSVRAPAVMPKPDLVALTGGYRRIPVLQIENHAYCDTALIARVLEARAPSPSLYGVPGAEFVAAWADNQLFEAVVPLGMRPTRFDDLMKYLTPDELSKMMDDRAAMRKDATRASISGKTARVLATHYFGRLEATLSASPYVAGNAPSIADFAVYTCAWFLKTLTPEFLEPFRNVEAWRARIAEIPDAPAAPMSADEALAVAAKASTAFTPETPFVDAGGLTAGQSVAVRASDYARDPIAGELVHATADEVVVKRTDERAGTVFVHFPRVGYEVKAE